jgi:hypothetical protein
MRVNALNAMWEGLPTLQSNILSYYVEDESRIKKFLD